MKYLLRHLASFILPISVLIILPVLIEPQLVPAPGILWLAGLALMWLGLYAMARTVRSFFQLGKGTLAPWDPPRRLIVAGMYAHVRNPMIMGVLAVLLGESLFFSSLALFILAVVFFAVNTLYFIMLEEPGLESRFGDEYREYKKNVRRWIPRLRPWAP